MLLNYIPVLDKNQKKMQLIKRISVLRIHIKHLEIQPEYKRIPFRYTGMRIQYMGIQIE